VNGRSGYQQSDAQLPAATPIRNPIPASTVAALASVEHYMTDCTGEPVALDSMIQQVTARIQADSLWYDKTELSDCSGIFHRVLQALKQQCAGYDFPSPQQFRDTRSLARWYHEHGDLILIPDALQSSGLLKPGAVLFFGHRDSLYQNFTVENLFEPKGIEHMGVVVSVEKDANGVVTSYKLFHGQTYGKIASVSNHHKRKPTRAYLPPYGNWNQQWVAFARIINPSAKLLTERR